MKHLSRLGVLLLSSILIIGCGGGGSTPTPGPTPVPSPSPTPTIQHFSGIFRAPKGTGAAAASVKGTFVSQATTVNMATARTHHQAVVLPDGTVLLLGGSTDPAGGFPVNSGEIFDPITETVAPIPPAVPGDPSPTMNQAREDFGAALMSNGKVFIIGGSDGSNFDIYDPVAHTFTKQLLTTPLLMGQIKAYSVVDPNAPGSVRVLILGGHDNIGNTNGPTEMDLTGLTPVQFPPIQATALPGLTINANDLKFEQSSVLSLHNGHLLITGGELSSTASSTSIFDYNPGDNTLTKIGNLSVARHAHSMLQLADGTVHVYGGVQAQADGTLARLTDVEQLNLTTTPVTGVHIGNLAAPRAAVKTVLLQNGTSVHVGGVDTTGVALNTQMLYVDGQDIGGLTGDMVTPRKDHTLTALSNGLVLIAGGSDQNGGVTNTLEIFDPQTSVYLQFPSDQISIAAGTVLFKLVDALGTLKTGATFSVSPTTAGTFAADGTFTPAKQGQAVVTATDGTSTAKVTITVIQ